MIPICDRTCTKAWLKAVNHLRGTESWRDYNLVLEIAEPMTLPKEDRAVHELMDAFLVEKASMRISTVINTIFPATLYVRYGKVGVFERYPELWRKLKTHPDVRWGTYFHRMTSRMKADQTELNPLADLIQKLSRQAATSGPKHAAYELGILDVDIPLYDPYSDGRQIMGGPCLSHLSFKVKDDARLMLTAFYRSHHYIKRALGNLFGLAWLQHFVAREVGLQTAELVCISSMATLDIKGWKKSDVTNLLDNCEAIVRPDVAAQDTSTELCRG